MNQVPPITGVAEVVLSVADIDKMKAFYQSVLGFSLYGEWCIPAGPDGEPTEPEEDSDEKPTIVFLTIRELDTILGRNGHPELLALIDYRRHANAVNRFDGHDVRRSTLNHLAFEIPPESYDAHWQRLTELGLSPTSTEFQSMQARAIFFRDPEDNVLELICHLAR